jgi:hypothetical protein
MAAKFNLDGATPEEFCIVAWYNERPFGKRMHLFGKCSRFSCCQVL